MTEEEAINVLDPIRRLTLETSTGGFEPRPIAKALQLAIEALEKQIPKKIKRYKVSPYLICFECPNCGTRLQASVKYCRYCGQRTDWSEVKE